MLFDSGASHSFIAASVVIELGLEVETLEEPLYVSSPLGIRARIGMICRGCELEISGTGDEGWIVHLDDSLRYRGWVVVPHLTDLREEILKEFHCSRFAVPPGGTKMYQDLRRQYYWSGMKRHIGDFVRRCLTCQQVKVEH